MSKILYNARIKITYRPTLDRFANKSLEEILTDHAFCEQKATTTCISLIQLFPDKELLVEKVAPIVSEEWAHFRAVVEELKKRGLKLGRQRKDEYVKALLDFQKKGGSREDHLLEKLLTAALIEARSCERFRLLSEGIEDADLRKFYHVFMIAEAAHYRLFLDLAKTYIPEEKVNTRWQQYLTREAEIMKDLELRGDRVH